MAPSRLRRPSPPVPLTPLVGRGREVDALLALLGEAVAHGLARHDVGALLKLREVQAGVEVRLQDVR